MRYYIRQYCHGMWRIRQLLPLVFLPSIVYLLVASAAPDRFSVIQKAVSYTHLTLPTKRIV